VLVALKKSQQQTAQAGKALLNPQGKMELMPAEPTLEKGGTLKIMPNLQNNSNIPVEVRQKVTLDGQEVPGNYLKEYTLQPNAGAGIGWVDIILSKEGQHVLSVCIEPKDPAKYNDTNKGNDCKTGNINVVIPVSPIDLELQYILKKAPDGSIQPISGEFNLSKGEALEIMPVIMNRSNITAEARLRVTLDGQEIPGDYPKEYRMEPGQGASPGWGRIFLKLTTDGAHTLAASVESKDPAKYTDANKANDSKVFTVTVAVPTVDLELRSFTYKDKDGNTKLLPENITFNRGEKIPLTPLIWNNSDKTLRVILQVNYGAEELYKKVYMLGPNQGTSAEISLDTTDKSDGMLSAFVTPESKDQYNDTVPKNNYKNISVKMVEKKKISGVALIRDASTSVPKASDPDVGKGYAKKTIEGINDIEGLRKAATLDTYKELIASYVKAGNKNPVQRQVMTYNQEGSVNTTGCAALGCEFIEVVEERKVSGVVLVRDASTSVPRAYDPDVGKGYAKRTIQYEKEGIVTNDIAGLLKAGTPEVYKELIAEYVKAGNTNPVQRQFATYGPDGTVYVTGCSAISCDYVKVVEEKKISGVALIRDASTSVPKASDPDVGKGYAKKTIPGINDIAGLRRAATPDIYKQLIAEYVEAGNKNPVQCQVLTYNQDGSPQTAACDDSGCDYVYAVAQPEVKDINVIGLPEGSEVTFNVEKPPLFFQVFPSVFWSFVWEKSFF